MTATDQFNNIATGYTGTVHFGSSDNQALLPADATLSGGIGLFAVILKTAGPQALTAIDPANSSISSINAFISVMAGAANHFVVSAPAATTAGSQLSFGVIPEDAFGNPATGYSGILHFSTGDQQGSFTTNNVTVSSGIGNFFAMLKTAGIQTLTVADTVHTGITGSALVTVAAAAASHFAVTAGATATTAGNPIAISVTALDSFGNVVTGYSGTMRFSSSDSQALLPSNATLSSGAGFFAAVLIKAGNQTITATDVTFGNISGTCSAVAVSAAAFTHFAITTPASVTAGQAFSVGVVAVDSLGNILTNYHGTVHFSSSDAVAGLPLDSTLTNGAALLSATFKTSGSQTLTASDAAAGINVSAAVIVSAASAIRFSVNTASATVAGGLAVTVSAFDSFNNVVTTYSGTVHFSSSDVQAVLPPDATFSGGIGYFGAIVKTVGNQTITVTDSASGITATSSPISVSPAATSHFGVAAPSNAITGVPFSFSVTALDAYNNLTPKYSGTVHFSSSDSAATLHVDASLVNGQGAFSATLATPGNQTITVTDDTASNITGASGTIVTQGLTVTSLTPTPSGFVADFNKPFDPTQINLYDAGGLYGPDDVLLTAANSPQVSFHGSLILSGGNTTITFVKTSLLTSPNFNPTTGVLTATSYPATYTVTLRGASNGFKDLLGAPLEGVNSGGNYVATFVVTAPPVVVGLPSFARGPDSVDAVNVPAGATTAGIPINLSNGSGVTSGKFTLQYNSALLTVSGATVNSALAGASLSLDSASTAGNAIIDFSSTTPLATSTAVSRLGGLVAIVPNSTIPLYKSKALLHWTGVQLNNTIGPITVEGDDAVEVVAYLGDTNGDGSLSAGDGTNISTFSSSTSSATSTLGGFSAYPLADPSIIGDLNNNGNADSGDVTLLNSYLAGMPHAQIPVPPAALAGFTVTGPDPALSLPTTLRAPPGGTVVVPVNIDTAHPDGSTAQ